MNAAEATRRSIHGLGAVEDPGLLAVLTTMPRGEAMRWSGLTRREQGLLRLAPAGVVIWTGAPTPVGSSNIVGRLRAGM